MLCIRFLSDLTCADFPLAQTRSPTPSAVISKMAPCIIKNIHLFICLLCEVSSVSVMFPLEQKTVQIGNRTRLEILASILKVASNGSLKTHIMYKANLSHRQLEKYLAFLQERGLLAEGIDEGTGSRIYRISEKGFDFLREYSHVSGYFTGNTA